MTKITQGSQLSPTPLPRLVLFLAFTITLSFALFLLLASRIFNPLMIPGPRPSQLFPRWSRGCWGGGLLCTLPPLQVPWMRTRVPQAWERETEPTVAQVPSLLLGKKLIQELITFPFRKWQPRTPAPLASPQGPSHVCSPTSSWSSFSSRLWASSAICTSGGPSHRQDFLHLPGWVLGRSHLI